MKWFGIATAIALLWGCKASPDTVILPIMGAEPRSARPPSGDGGSDGNDGGDGEGRAALPDGGAIGTGEPPSDAGVESMLDGATSSPTDGGSKMTRDSGSGSTVSKPAPDAAAPPKPDAGSMMTGPDAAVEPPEPKPNGAELFGQDGIVEIRIQMDDEPARALEEQGEHETYLPAAVTVKGADFETSFARVGVRHPGDRDYQRCFEGGVRDRQSSCERLPFDIKLDAFDDETRLFGLARLFVNALSYDGSKMREQIAFELFRRAGVTAPRTTYGIVFFNDEPRGLFSVIESVDGSFVADRFGDDGSGHVYTEAWPIADLDAQAYLAQLQGGGEPQDVADMLGFAAAVSKSEPDSFAQTMQAWVSLDELLRFIAIDRAIKNWDGVTTFYAGEAPHNVYWYRGSATDSLFHLIPWDLDQSLWPHDPFVHPDDANLNAEPLPGWNVKPDSCELISLWRTGNTTAAPPSGCDPFLNLLAATHWDRYVELGRELLAGPLAPDTMEGLLEAHRARIDGAVRNDPLSSHTSWQGHVLELRGVVRNTAAYFEAHLAEGYQE